MTTAAYMRDYRARRRDNGGHPLRKGKWTPVPYMTEVVAAAWLRIGRPGPLGYDFACYCPVCATLRRKTVEPV